jgi:hypothetical protein
VTAIREPTVLRKLGDVRESDFSRLTVKVWTQSAGTQRLEVPVHG